MSETKFQKFWNNQYGLLTPVGWNLTRDLAHLRTRFHALPESKRYPESNQERQTIVNRANTLLREIIGDDNSFWLISSRRKPHKSIVDNAAKQRFAIEKFELLEEFEWVDLKDDIEDQLPWQTYTRYFDKLGVDFDTLFLKIADEEDWATLFINAHNGDILAPYDGGFDLIVNDISKILTLETVSYTHLTLPTKA